MTRILAIETSCDETSAAVVRCEGKCDPMRHGDPVELCELNGSVCERCLHHRHQLLGVAAD